MQAEILSEVIHDAIDQIDPNVSCATGAVRDTAERKQIENELWTNESRFKTAQRIGMLGFLDMDLMTDEIDMSDEALRIYGLDPTRKKIGIGEIIKLVHPDDVSHAVQCLSSAIDRGEKHDIEHRIVRLDGEVIYVHTCGEVQKDASGKPVRFLGTIQNITKIKLTQMALRQINNELEHRVAVGTADLLEAKEQAETAKHDLATANEAAEVAHRASKVRLVMEAESRMRTRKLEAMGMLAAGFAHDFNNILGSIVGFAEMTDDDLPDDSNAKRNVAQIVSGSLRASALADRMLVFARQSPAHPVAVNLVVQVCEAVDLLRASLRPSIRLSFQSSLGEANATILADPTQIVQIVMNLCINAADAMDNHGVIHVYIDRAGQIKEAPPGYLDGTCLTVSDTGCGMTPEVLKRQFDPFFTTKEPGKGSGLGLSVVHGIVTSLGGVIEVLSRVGGGNTGTDFRIFLPTTTNNVLNGEMHGAHLVD